jgi:L-malate glycosyltransferase
MSNSLLMVGNFLSAAVGNRGVCEELAEHLAVQGWSVLTTSSRPSRVARLTDMLSTAWQNRRRYDVAQVDVFSGPSFVWAEAAAWVLRRARKPYVLTLHGGALPSYARRWTTRTRRLLASADAVTVPSRYLAESMRRYRSDLRLIPNGIELKQYPYRRRDSVEPRLVWLRAFHRIYDPSLAVRTLALLRQRDRPATLTMVGSDKGDSSLDEARTAARELGVAGHTRFVGAVPKAEVGRWIDRGDIFLNTATVDNTPVSILEAMACGACIVSTNVGGIPHLLREGHNALMVGPGDPSRMASAVERLLESPPLAALLSRNAREDSAAFDWSRVIPQWHSLLRSFTCD